MARGGSEDARPRPVTAGDLPPHKARVLLMLALTRTRDPAEIQRLFDTH
jgi:L-asparaginase/Glu-tRNA(Gln) amidotransferase subunit D